MTTTLIFDTHEFVTELKQAGLSESQAEVITRLHRQATNATIDYVKHEHSLDNLVTNKDLDARIKEIRAKNRAGALRIEAGHCRN